MDDSKLKISIRFSKTGTVLFNLPFEPKLLVLLTYIHSGINRSVTSLMDKLSNLKKSRRYYMREMASALDRFDT